MVQISGIVRKRNGKIWVVFDDSNSKKAGLQIGQEIIINNITPTKKISAFGKYPGLKSFVRDPDREF